MNLRTLMLIFAINYNPIFLQIENQAAKPNNKIRVLRPLWALLNHAENSEKCRKGEKSITLAIL